MIKRIIPILILQFVIAGTPQFGDKQIVIMLKEYFHADQNAPELIGQRFYLNRGEMVIQLEVDATAQNVNETLLFGFKAMSQIANISKTDFTQSILVLHFRGNILPSVAKSDIQCSKDFFINHTINENKWRKDCLIIGGN